jgi:hypothetical protein
LKLVHVKPAFMTDEILVDRFHWRAASTIQRPRLALHNSSLRAITPSSKQKCPAGRQVFFTEARFYGCLPAVRQRLQA